MIKGITEHRFTEEKTEAGGLKLKKKPKTGIWRGFRLTPEKKR